MADVKRQIAVSKWMGMVNVSVEAEMILDPALLANQGRNSRIRDFAANLVRRAVLRGNKPQQN